MYSNRFYSFLKKKEKKDFQCTLTYRAFSKKRKILHTNFGAKALHPRYKDIGRKEPPHGLAAIDGKLTAVKILINILRVPVPEGHDRGFKFAATVIIIGDNGDGAVAGTFSVPRGCR